MDDISLSFSRNTFFVNPPSVIGIYSFATHEEPWFIDDKLTITCNVDSTSKCRVLCLFHANFNFLTTFQRISRWLSVLSKFRWDFLCFIVTVTMHSYFAVFLTSFYLQERLESLFLLPITLENFCGFVSYTLKFSRDSLKKLCVEFYNLNLVEFMNSKDFCQLPAETIGEVAQPWYSLKFGPK
uniref:BTB domain-containing protein n=1 Tax=Panagrellus redivivus TaxID=6233 RepID=A0A7E4WBA1_PANRE